MIFLLNCDRKYCKNKVAPKATKKIDWELKQSKRENPMRKSLKKKCPSSMK
jgi:hypothetical protein